ncbi:acid protease [Hypoxylon sp. FL1150]|nr:acid protease [Hypoxylon sp. FL1150]
MKSIYLLLVTLVAPVCTTTCEEVSPFQLPIKDVQVLPNISESFMRGISLSVGTPPQDIVLLPWPELNNTWIYDQQAYCDSSIIWNNVICQVRRGNYYLEGNSSTIAKSDDIIAAGGAGTETQSSGSELGIGKFTTSSLAGTDTFSLNSTTTLSAAFPFGIPRLSWDHGYTMLHAMGMGTNSTFLTTLLQTGRIGSRVWSIFWGRMWVDDEDAIDGSIVFGGFDQQKTLGKNYTQPLDFSDTTGCWTGMKVQISKLNLNFRNGDDVDLLPANTLIDACIVPQRQLLLEAPGTIVQTFEKETGMESYARSYGLHWSSYLYNTSDLFDGDLTISLSTGLDIRIPNNQYLVPYVDIDRNGSRIIDTSVRELLVNGLSDQPATLGRYFLTAAYLMVDLDSNTFTLWQANPTRDSKLVSAAANRATDSQCVNDTSIPGSNGTASDLSQAPQQANGLSGGSIAGIVVGVIAGLAVLGLGVFFYLRRARNGAQFTQSDEATPAMGDQSRVDQNSGLQHPDSTKQLQAPIHELRGSPAALSEVSGHHNYVYEMNGDERYAGRTH